IELSKRREAAVEAIDVLAAVKAPSSEVCEALLDLASTRRGAWADALRALGGHGARCSAQHERAVQVTVGFIERGSGPTRARGLAEVADEIRRFVRDAELSPELRSTLRVAVEAAVPTVEDPVALDEL